MRGGGDRRALRQRYGQGARAGATLRRAGHLQRHRRSPRDGRPRCGCRDDSQSSSRTTHAECASERHARAVRTSFRALSSRGVERILAAAKRADRRVFIANNHRFRTDVQALQSFIQGGELGKIQGVRAGAYRVKSTIAPWRLRRAEAGGGAFLEHGLPLLDLGQRQYAWVADAVPACWCAPAPRWTGLRGRQYSSRRSRFSCSPSARAGLP